MYTVLVDFNTVAADIIFQLQPVCGILLQFTHRCWETHVTLVSRKQGL
jgi:hypothetical protein